MPKKSNKPLIGAFLSAKSIAGMPAYLMQGGYRLVNLYWWQELGRSGRNADGIRDHKVEAERRKAEIEVARLEHVRSETVRALNHPRKRGNQYGN